MMCVKTVLLWTELSVVGVVRGEQIEVRSVGVEYIFLLSCCKSGCKGRPLSS